MIESNFGLFNCTITGESIQLEPSVGMNLNKTKIVNGRYIPFTTDEISNYELAMIVEARALKTLEIDSNTEELLDKGFQYPVGSGNYFPLTNIAKHNLNGLFNKRNDPIYTIYYPAINDFILPILNSSDLEAFYNAAFMRESTVRLYGVELYKLINACTSVEDVYAITDDRS